MSRFLKLVAKLIILGCFTCGCSSQVQQAPTKIPTVDLTPLTLGILVSEEINASDFLKVDDGLLISDRSDCLPEDCAHSVWNILEQDSLGLTVSNSTLQLGISIKGFQTAEAANSLAEKIIRENGGQPGIRMIEIPLEILPEQSSAYAEDGRLITVITVYGNIQISLSLSQYTGGINETEKAVVLLTDLAKMQIDKLVLSNKK